MQVNNQFSTNQLQSTDRPLELKQGELYKAQIKERVSDTEAVIQIRGKEVKATFEGKVPSEDRVTVQVTGQKDQAVTLKTVSVDVPKTSSTQSQQVQPSSDAKLFQSIGITDKDIPELKQSVQILLDKGIPVTKEAVQELRDFFEKAQGSMAAKLDTVKALANKKLEVTQSHLRPIHEALHGRPLNEVLTDLAKEIDPEFDLAKNEQKDSVRRHPQGNLENSQKQTNETTSKVVNPAPVSDPKKTEQTKTQTVTRDNKVVDLLQRNREFVEKAPDLKQAIEKVRSEIVKNPAIDQELAQKIDKAAFEAEKLQSIGKERLVQVLKNAEEQLVKKEQQIQESFRGTVNQNRTTESTPLREATPGEIVKAVKEDVSKAASLQRSIETVQKQILDNPRIPSEVANKVKHAVEEAGRLQQQGRITVGKETLISALNSIEAELEVLDSASKNRQQVTQGETQSLKTNPQHPRVEQPQPGVRLKDDVQTIEVRTNDTKVSQAQLQQTQTKQQSSEQLASEIVKQAKEGVQRDSNLHRAIEKVREQVVNNPKVDMEVAKKIDKALNEARQLQQIGRESMGRERIVQGLTQAENELKQIETRRQQPVKTDQSQPDGSTKEEVHVNEDVRIKDVKMAQAQPQQTQPAQRTKEQSTSEMVKQAKEEVQRDPNLQRGIEKVREQVVNNPKVDVEVAQKVEKAVNEARQLQQIGRESMGRDRLVQALAQAENELKRIETRQQQSAKVEQAQPDSRTKDEVQINEMRSIDAKAGRTQQQAHPAPRTNEQPASETVEQVKEEVKREPNLQRAIEKVREQVVNNPKVDVEIAQKVDKAVSEARQLQQIGRESMGKDRLAQALAQAENELKQIESRQQQQTRVEQPQSDVRTKDEVQTNEVRSNDAKAGQAQQQTQPAHRTHEQPASETVEQVKEEVKREPNLQRAIEKVREQVVNNPKVDVEIAQKVDKAVSEARQLQQIGRESMGRERLAQALTQAENELKQIESRQQQQPTRVEQPQPDVRTKGAVQTNEARSNDAKVGQAQQQAQPAPRTNDQPASETVKQVKEEVQRDLNLQRAIEKVREQVVNNPKVDVEVAQKVEKAANEARQLQQIGRESMGRERLVQALNQAENELKQIESRQQPQPARVEQPQSDAKPEGEVQTNEARTNDVKASQAQQQTQPAQRPNEQPASEIVKQAKEEVQRDPNLQRAIEKVREQVVNNPKVNIEVAQKIDRALNDADQLQRIDRETMGREHLSRALVQAESELKQIETRQQQSINQETPEQLAIETIKQIKEGIESQPDLQRAINEVRDQLKNNKDIHPKIVDTIEKVANQASQLDQAGRERISKILEQAVDQIKQSTTATSENADPKGQIQPGENSTKIKVDQQPTQQKPTTQQETNHKLSQILANLLDQESQTERNKPNPSAQINEVLKQIQKESNLDQGLTQIRKELLSNPNLDLKTIEKIENAIQSSSQLLEKGRELGARQQITNSLNEIEQELSKTESKQQSQPMDQQKGIQEELIKQFDKNEEFQTLPLHTKNILVTKATQKLAKATHDFRELKREITKNLDTVERLINTFKKNAYPQAKQMLETTISKLDNAILKSDMMLFTDMKTEKKLMQASSQLADAKKLLAKGNHAEAAKIVHDIKTLLDKINFKPSEQKVMHFVGKESTNLEQIHKSPSHQLLNQFDETARSYVRQEPSARQMFEMVRSLGLNHDSDLAKSLVFQKGGESPFQQGQQEQQNQQQQENLKAALMKLTQTGGDEGSTRIAQQAEQALNNLTGQQLLSKADSGNTLQSMFFNLPLLLGEKPENLQVFVNSKKEGQQVDWENCNLYFLIETKRLGDVGIMLTSTDRNLSITIKNDKPGFKQKMEPIAAITKEKLQEVGYSINSINFTRMTATNNQTTNTKQHDDTNIQEHQSQIRPVFTEKGMDFKI